MSNDRERAKQIDELLSKVEPKLKAAFSTGLKSIQESVSLDKIEEAIRYGDYHKAFELINELIVATAFIEFNRQIQAAVQAGGDIAASWAGAQKIVFGLNVTESNVARFINSYQASKIREITEDMQRLFGEMVRNATISGVNPRTAAREIKASIGLTARQQAAVQNFERLLRERKAEALTRSIRDKRFDRSILSAIADERELTEEQISRMVSRYRERMIAKRAETIARTESIRLVSVGQNEFWEQAIASGQVARERLKRKWVPTNDSRTRESHRAIPGMNPDGVGMDEPFKSPEGPIMYPGDISAPPSNSINCRCAVFVRVEAE